MRSINNERGSSLVEFIVFAPLLSLMLYMSFDINEAIFEKGDMSLSARNAIFLYKVDGDFYKQRVMDIFAEDKSTNMSHNIDVIDQSQLQTSQKTQEMISASGSNSDNLDADYANTSMQQTSYTLDASLALDPLYQQDPLLKDQRIIAINISDANFTKESTFKKSTELLLNMFTQGNQEQISQSKSSRLFFRGGHGHHSDQLPKLGNYAIALTKVIPDDYGTETSDDHLFFQSYCMSNIASSKTCGSVAFVYLESEGSFANITHQLSMAKVSLSLLMNETDYTNLQQQIQAIAQNTMSTEEFSYTQSFLNFSDNFSLVTGELVNMKDHITSPTEFFSSDLKGRINFKGELYE